MKLFIFNPKSYPQLILGGVSIIFLIGGIMLFNSSPAPERALKKESALRVVVETITATSFQVVLDSYGVVEPKRESSLIAELKGMITEINANFYSGGFFRKGETLLVIDPRDYALAVTEAKASLADAEQQLIWEQARTQQALLDWQAISGNETPASDLLLRKPQLSSAKSRLNSAKALLERAEINLARTRITAPYDSRLRSKAVDLGEVVNIGTVLGSLYSTDFLEIRLPLRNQELPFIDLPEQNINIKTDARDFPKVKIISSLVEDQLWEGAVVRTEGVLDNDSKQLYVVAQIVNPYIASNADQYPLKIGEYVRTEIMGRVIENAIVIAVDSIYENSYVYVLAEGIIKRKVIDVAWQNSEWALLKNGLVAGDQLILNRLGSNVNGWVAVVDKNLVDADTKLDISF